MSLPYSVSLVGPLLAVILYILIFAAIIICTNLLVDVANQSNFKGDKYETLGELVWGKKGKYFIEATLHATLLFGYIAVIVFTMNYFT